MLINTRTSSYLKRTKLQERQTQAAGEVQPYLNQQSILLSVRVVSTNAQDFLGWWKVSEFDTSASWIFKKYQSDPVWKKEITISYRSFHVFLLTLEAFYFRQLGVITGIYCSLEFERESCRKIIKLLWMLIMLSKFYLHCGIGYLDPPKQNPNWKITHF